jgi:hypothetical protein
LASRMERVLTKTTRKTAQLQETNFLFPQFETTAFSGDLFSAYVQGSQAFLESAVALNQEILRFANERLEADAQAL